MHVTLGRESLADEVRNAPGMLQEVGAVRGPPLVSLAPVGGSRTGYWQAVALAVGVVPRRRSVFLASRRRGEERRRLLG
eukprot:3869875-Alexandrium_andersonii.AAC.1